MTSAMHLNWRATLSNKPHILIAAISGRALAQAAKDSGYIPLVADMFGDDDTRALAGAASVVPGSLDRGFDRAALAKSLKALAKGRDPVGLVYGAGFESDPSLLAGFDVIGNGPAVVERLKKPMGFAADLKRLGISHPAVSDIPPQLAKGWLTKTAGASGGSHIQQAVLPAADGRYYQEFIDGMPISALFAADGAKAQILGFSRQWCAPTQAIPFRYGGAAQPSGLPEARLAPLADAVQKLAREYALKGFNSADFIVAENRFWLLEVNPRPGATLDVFRAAIPDLFSRHVAACGGKFLDAPAPAKRSTAQAIVYATQAIGKIPEIVGPPWAMDRQPAGSAVAKDSPLCSVMADGETAIDAIAGTTGRAHIIKTQLERKAQ